MHFLKKRSFFVIVFVNENNNGSAVPVAAVASDEVCAQ